MHAVWVEVHVIVGVHCCIGIEETDFQFVTHLKRDQSQYVME